MAIYHLRASVISRSQGRSATAAIAYRVAERIEDRRTGLTFDYAARSGVDHTEILAPDHAPDWVRDRSELWNRVEESETRKNSQVAREVRVALPDELSHEARVALVRDFVRAAFVDRGMVADIALPAPGRPGDERNPPAHIRLTTSVSGAQSFSTKHRNWNKGELLEHMWGARGRDRNAARERAGRDESVDHGTLEAQRDEARERPKAARERGDEAKELEQTVRAVSLDRPPLPQLSPGAWQMKERGIDVGRVAAWYEVKARAAEVAILARDLAEHVREWLDRAANRVLGAERPEPALAGPPVERDWDRERTDLTARLRAALGPGDRETGASAEDGGVPRERDSEADPDREAPQDDLAARLRAAAKGVDQDALSRAAAELRETREAGEREAELARQREVERQKEIEREREARDAAERDSGWGLER